VLSRAAQVSSEVQDGTDAGLTRLGRELVQLHLLDHELTQWRDSLGGDDHG